MRARIVRIGNSRGLRIPKPILEQAGLEDEVELTVEGDRVVIQSSHRPRAGWSDAAKQAATQRQDALVAPVLPTRFDREEWSW